MTLSSLGAVLALLSPVDFAKSARRTHHTCGMITCVGVNETGECEYQPIWPRVLKGDDFLKDDRDVQTFNALLAYANNLQLASYLSTHYLKSNRLRAVRRTRTVTCL